MQVLTTAPPPHVPTTALAAVRAPHASAHHSAPPACAHHGARGRTRAACKCSPQRPPRMCPPRRSRPYARRTQVLTTAPPPHVPTAALAAVRAPHASAHHSAPPACAHRG